MAELWKTCPAAMTDAVDIVYNRTEQSIFKAYLFVLG